MRELFKKYIHFIAYVFWGICTTLVNIFIFWLCSFHLEWGTLSSTILAWCIAVLFAYLTNRHWVFHSKSSKVLEILSEISCFFISRLVTGIIDWIGMWMLVDLMHFNSIFMKLILNIIVIILNYIASKLIVFKYN